MKLATKEKRLLILVFAVYLTWLLVECSRPKLNIDFQAQAKQAIFEAGYTEQIINTRRAFYGIKLTEVLYFDGKIFWFKNTRGVWCKFLKEEKK